MEQPITIHPLLYVLKLEDDCWYVGISYQLNVRLAQHWGSAAAKWTKLHKPVSLERVVYPASLELENKITLELIEQWGKDKVCGGSFCKVKKT